MKELLKKMNHIARSSMFWVRVYIFIVAMLLLLQALPHAMEQVFGHDINMEFTLPMEIISWSFMALVSIYVGTDRLEKIISSKEIPYGEIFMGDMKKLRRVIIFSLILFLESMTLSLLFSGEYGMSGFFTAFSSSIILYISGNKLIKTMGNIDGEHQNVKDDENIIKDINVNDSEI